MKRGCMRGAGSAALIRMPLHTDDPPRPMMDGPKKPILTPPHRDEPLPEPVQALVVVRHSRDRISPHRLADPTSRLKDDLVEHRLSERLAVSPRAGQVRKVLDQGAPECDVGNLHTPTDAQGRQAE